MSLVESPSAQVLDAAEENLPPQGAVAVVRRRGLRTWPISLQIGVLVLATIVVVLLLTPWIAPYPPEAQDLANRLAPPGGDHLLGTDQLGRDVLSRLMYGGRFSMTIAAIATVISGVVGTVLGIVCARVRGALDEIVMRTTDVLLAFPEMIVAMFLVAILGPGYGTLVLALVIGGWTPFARLARGLAMEISSRDFIEAADALGFSRRFIIFRHILPNALSPIMAHASLRFGHKLITVGALSFLGLGVQPPASDWGSMLADGQPYMTRAAGLVLYPGLTIFITALAVTLIGQGLNARRSRQR
jgi:peptide/nickel transport system permease protein